MKLPPPCLTDKMRPFCLKIVGLDQIQHILTLVGFVRFKVHLLNPQFFYFSFPFLVDYDLNKLAGTYFFPPCFSFFSK